MLPRFPVLLIWPNVLASLFLLLRGGGTLVSRGGFLLVVPETQWEGEHQYLLRFLRQNSWQFKVPSTW